MRESLPDVEGLGVDDLKKLALQLLEENAALRADVAALRAENRRLRACGQETRPRCRNELVMV